jgi:predicted ATPase
MELGFLADLASDRRLKQLQFLIIGAFRDNEVGPEHPLTTTLNSMELNSVPIHIIDILPFTVEDMEDLLFEIIGGNDVDRQNVLALADILIQKSRGNLVFHLEVCS